MTANNTQVRILHRFSDLLFLQLSTLTTFIEPNPTVPKSRAWPVIAFRESKSRSSALFRKKTPQIILSQKRLGSCFCKPTCGKVTMQVVPAVQNRYFNVGAHLVLMCIRSCRIASLIRTSESGLEILGFLSLSMNYFRNHLDYTKDFRNSCKLQCSLSR